MTILLLICQLVANVWLFVEILQTRMYLERAYRSVREIDPYKLRLLSLYVDTLRPDDPDREVQEDLVRWAENLESWKPFVATAVKKEHH
jgi:hypothetical protein